VVVGRGDAGVLEQAVPAAVVVVAEVELHDGVRHPAVQAEPAAVVPAAGAVVVGPAELDGDLVAEGGPDADRAAVGAAVAAAVVGCLTVFDDGAVGRLDEDAAAGAVLL